ncbi:MAG: hypothetical protein Alpg2KO_04680 [Alphaproteobacteria bacterium]
MGGAWQGGCQDGQGQGKCQSRQKGQAHRVGLLINWDGMVKRAGWYHKHRYMHKHRDRAGSIPQ